MPNVLLDGCLMIVLVFSCNPLACATDCIPVVLASRRTLFVPEGGSVSLQCEVRDCGPKDWTGGWSLNAQGSFTPLKPSPKLHLSNHTVSANSTCLLVSIQNLSQSDSGEYKCVVLMGSYTIQGHITQLNVTTAESTARKLSHRFLVCLGASLCFLLALGLACCLAVSKRLRSPPVPPHFRTTPTARVRPKAEVVYAAVVLKSPRQAESKSPEAREPIVYSSLNFSAV
ncbi:uncharacterized protein [Salminus brasiliensis]|uniref:uncharacterized protein isoform X2 n=1 Tax=Salminus brasiliensis TaxID=930266 RepID=UPI003B833400